MYNIFNDKVNNFTEWSKIAFEHFNSGYYADSLTNMRKSGEAACKIMILHKFSEKISENKIGQKNYKELIDLIIKDNLAPRKVINWLETLQIHGNAATHDAQIMQEQAYYGIIALRLLIYWLFLDLFNASVPAGLKKEISQIKDKPVAIADSKKVEEERRKLIKEKEEFEKKLNILKGKEKQDNDKIANLAIELNNSVTKIKELDTAQQKIINLEKELSRYKIETEALKQKQNVIVIPKKKYTARIIIFTLLAVLLVFAGIYFYKNYHKPAASENIITEFNKQHADSFKVIVFPFIILQDNPTLKINFEDAMINRIRQYIQDLKLPIEIVYKSSVIKSAVSKNDMLTEGLKEKAAIVLYGELYEPSNNDSAQVNIKNVRIGVNNTVFDETGIKAFSKLSDSSAIRIIQEIECIMNYTVVENFTEKRKYSDALALIYKATPISNFQKKYYSNVLAICHLALKNFNAAIIEAEKYITLQPDSSFPYCLLGEIYKKKGDYAKANIYFRKSLSINPNYVSALQQYASSLAILDTNNLPMAKALICEALEYDSTDASSWYCLAQIADVMKDYNAAEKHYIKYVGMAPDSVQAKRNLAAILAFRLNEPTRAIEYLNCALAKDSNDLETLMLLASIYTNSTLKNPEKAEYLYKKCKSLKKEPDNYETDAGLGLTAFAKGNYDAALTYFLKAYSVNKPNKKFLLGYISQIYISTKDYANAEKYMLEAYRFDSMNYTNNYNLGWLYLNATGPLQNEKKAAFYFERELQTYPYDTMALQWLTTIYNNRKDIKRTKDLCTKIIALTPNSSFVYKALGHLAELENNIDSALFYYKKSFQICPTDPDCSYKISILLMNEMPEKSWREAKNYAERSLALEPLSATYNYVYAQILVYTGSYKKGAEYYYKAIELYPSLKDTTIERQLKKMGLL